MRDGDLTSIVLAAGRSTRLPGRNKLLLPVRGKVVVRRVVEALLAGGGAPVIVVVGHDALDVTSALGGLGVRLVPNAAFAEGMGTSVAAGVAAADPESDGYLLCLGDLPGLSSDAVALVVEEFRRLGGEIVVVPTYRGRRGHPVVFPARCRAALMALSGDEGARSVVQREAVAEVAVEDPGVVEDIDTPDDYRAFGEG